MKIIESEKFRKMGESAAETLREFGDRMNGEQREFLTLKKKRAETHKKIEEATGLKFAVANDVEPGVAAFVTVSDAKAHITESTLDDPEFALHGARHEEGHVDHLQHGIKDISLKDNLEDGDFSVLSEYMGARGFDMDQVDLLEGFNEFDNAVKHGSNDKCGYNRLEVPAAGLLEKLCLENTGRSLLEAFRARNMDLFYELVSSICGIIRVKEFLREAA